MVGIFEAKAAYDGIKAAIEMTKGVAALKTETEINAAVVSIQRQLLDAQSAALDDREKMTALRSENDLLRRQLAENDAWEAEKARYRLTKSSMGAYTYVLISENADGEEAHRLCTTCFENQKKSILHTINKHSGGETVRCNVCKEDLTLSEFGSTVVIGDDDYNDRYY